MSVPTSVRAWLWGTGVILAALLASQAGFATTIDVAVIAMPGSAVPGGATQMFAAFDGVALTSTSDLLFKGLTTSTTTNGLYELSAGAQTTALSPLFVNGDPAPGAVDQASGNQGVFDSLSPVAINRSDFIAFGAGIKVQNVFNQSVSHSGVFTVPSDTPGGSLVTNFQGLDFGTDNGSITIRNGATGNLLGGFFSNAAASVAADNTVVLDASFGGGTPGGGGGAVTPVQRGLFVGTKLNDWVAVLRDGDPLPAFVGRAPGVTMRVEDLYLSKAGTGIYFSTRQSDGSRAFWHRATGGGVRLLAQDDDPAPGLPGSTWSPVPPRSPFSTGLPNAFADQLLIPGTATTTATGKVVQAFWLQDASGALIPVLQATADESIVTSTSTGPVRFRSIDRPLVGPSGEIVFTGTARTAAGDLVTGIWRRAGDATHTVTLLLATNTAAPGQTTDQALSPGSLFFQDFTPRQINANGQVLFSSTLFRNSFTTGSLWAVAGDGTLSFVAKEGDTIRGPGGGLVLDQFFFNRRGTDAGNLAFNDNGTVAFLGFAPDGPDPGSSRDPVVFLATPVTPANMTGFIWSGACGGSMNWHDGCADSNWNDAAGSGPAGFPPGDGAGTETVTITNADVELTNRAADIKSIQATGSLTVDRPLTVHEASSIENLDLNADLTADGPVTLSGTANFWNGGQLAGVAGVRVASGADLAIEPAQTGAVVPLNLATALGVDGNVTQTDTTLRLVDGTASTGTTGISIGSGGTYELENGGIVDATTAGGNLSNAGTFRKSGPGSATVGVAFDNQGAMIDVSAGTLEFTAGNTQRAGSRLSVARGATLAFTGGATAPSITILGDVTAGGEGTLRLSCVMLDIDPAASFNLSNSGSGNGLVIENSTIRGSGPVATSGPRLTVQDTGRAELRKGTVLEQAELLNRGTLVIAGNGSVNPTLTTQAGARLNNEGTLIQDGIILQTDILLPAPTARNAGTWTIKDSLLGRNSQFENTTGGSLVKSGSGTAFFEPMLTSRGQLIVQEGQLQLQQAAFDGGMIDVEAGATLAFDGSNPAATVDINKSLTAAGAGVLRVDSGAEVAIHDFQTFTIGLNGGGDDGLVIADASVSLGSGRLAIASQGRVRLKADTELFSDIGGLLKNDGRLVIDRGAGTAGAGVMFGDGMTVINQGVVVQDGRIDLQTDLLNSLLLGNLTNSGKWTISADLRGDPDVWTFRNVGQLIKTGSGTVVFEPTLAGGIEVKEGRLELQRVEPSPGDNPIQVDAGASLGSPSGGAALRFSGSAGDSGTVNLQAGGRWEITTGIETPGLDRLVVRGAGVVNWLSGPVSAKLTLAGATLNIGRLAPADLTLSNSLLKGDGSVGPTVSFIKQFRDLILSNSTVELGNASWFMNVAGTDILAADQSSFFKIGTADAIGFLGVETGGEHVIEPQTDVRRHGTVRVGKGSTLRILRPTKGTLDANRVLRSGEYEVSGASRVFLGPRFNIPDITGIGKFAAVELTESPVGARPQLNNLPDPNGDFSNDGFLTLRGLRFRVHDGEFHNTGSVVLDNGSLFADQLLINDGIISGTGVLNGKTFINGNVVKPGKSPGLITVQGDYRQTATGVLDIELAGLDPAQFDRLVVSGVASFEPGARIDLHTIGLGGGATFVPRTGDRFAFLVAQSIDLQGQQPADLLNFVDLPRGLRLLPFLDTVNGQQVFSLEALFGSSLSALGGLTPAQRSVASALDAASLSGSSNALTDFALALDGLPTAALKQQALNSAGMSLGSATFDLSRAAFATGGRHVREHLDSLVWKSSSGTGTAANPTPVAQLAATHPSELLAMSHGGLPVHSAADLIYATAAAAGTSFSRPPSPHTGWRMFSAGTYEFGNFDAASDQQSIDYTGGGATVGLELAGPMDDWVAGIAGSASELDGDATVGSDHVQADGVSFYLYGLARLPLGLVTDGMAGFGWVDTDYRRTLATGGPTTARGKPDGSAVDVLARLSRPWEVGPALLGPVFELDYSRTRLDSYTEQDGGAASLIVEPGSYKTFSARAGLRLDASVPGRWGTLQPSFTALYQHVLSIDTPTLRSAFAGAPDNHFFTPIGDSGRDGVRLSAALVLHKRNLNLSLGYDGLLLKGGTSSQAAHAAISWSF